MLFEYRYFGATAVGSTSTTSGLSFAPDVRRQPTFLTGKLRRKLPFREAISALHAVVVSDLRFRPRDRSEYLAWRANQDDLDLAALATVRRDLSTQVAIVRAELEQLRATQRSRWNPFHAARKRFFDWLYKRSLDMWLVLDPVITVHPDEVTFECFSQDESSYGRLACSHEVFEQLGELAYGTTNVDYSYTLFDEFQKIRDDKDTTFKVDPAGFDVQTGDDEVYREVKIDLPDSWVRGFLQVGTAMGLPGATRLELHPMDVHNLCLTLRRHKETRGPRSLRFLLEPDRPVRIRIEPFGFELDCPRSTHDARSAAEIRVWGRRRLLVLERLIPVARSVSVVLLGSGMPSFWIARCGDLTFTLGLSGWTANDWSASGNFDLLAPRGDVDAATAEGVLGALRTRWLATEDELATALGLDRGTVGSALVAFAQAGRTMYDLDRGVWRLRELSRVPLDLATLRWSNAREAEAALLAPSAVYTITPLGDRTAIAGQVGDRRASVTLDGDRRLVAGECTCPWHFQNKLRKGPCPHLLALRLAFERRLGTEAPAGPAGTTAPAAKASSGSASRGGSVVDRLLDASWARSRAPGAGAPARPPARRRPGPIATDREDADGDDDDDRDRDVDESDVRAPVSIAKLGEAHRFVALLRERGLVELDDHHPTFVTQVAQVLRFKGDVGTRAQTLFTVLERNPEVQEFYVLEVEDLIGLLEEWG